MCFFWRFFGACMRTKSVRNMGGTVFWINEPIVQSLIRYVHAACNSIINMQQLPNWILLVGILYLFLLSIKNENNHFKYCNIYIQLYIFVYILIFLCRRGWLYFLDWVNYQKAILYYVKIRKVCQWKIWLCDCFTLMWFEFKLDLRTQST